MGPNVERTQTMLEHTRWAALDKGSRKLLTEGKEVLHVVMGGEKGKVVTATYRLFLVVEAVQPESFTMDRPSSLWTWHEDGMRVKVKRTLHIRSGDGKRLIEKQRLRDGWVDYLEME